VLKYRLREQFAGYFAAAVSGGSPSPRHLH